MLKVAINTITITLFILRSLEKLFIHINPTNFIKECCIEYTLPWTRFELTTLVAIGTDCIGSCKPNYHMITTRTVLTDTILKGDHLRIISAKFGWDWLSSFTGEDFFLISSPLFLKMPKFELYKHNDELFNIYYGIFYELWTLTDYEIKKKGGWN
jgi:hypothetical protein